MLVSVGVCREQSQAANLLEEVAAIASLHTLIFIHKHSYLTAEENFVLPWGLIHMDGDFADTPRI